MDSSEEEIEGEEEEESASEASESSGNFQILSESATCVKNVGAVVSQLKTWDQLMTARIKLQQVMKFANCLSLQNCEVSGNKDIKKSATLSFKRAEKMQAHLQSLTGSLLTSLSVEEEEGGSFDLNKPDALWQPILEQWWNKTCLPQQSGGKRSAKNGNFTQLEESPVKYARRLMSDKSTLLRRAHLKRLDYRVGCATGGGGDLMSDANVDEYDTKIFDDNDFYQTLIRDVISKKLAGTNDPSAMTRAMLSGEKLTAEILKPKKKQAVDRRASKGRKIRYNVMPKLVNYTGPDSNKISWTDQQRDELFKSLFQQI